MNESSHGENRRLSIFQGVRYLWASPNSCLGLVIGCASLCCGGGVTCRGGVLGFTGRMIEVIFDRLPIRPRAMTLGHVILARDPGSFQTTFLHELVHVEQYERWGPIFLPAYLGCSLVVRLRGCDPYLDNPFEREAFERVPRSSSPGKDSDQSEQSLEAQG